MFYRDTEIDELMTDAVVHGVDEANQATFKYRIGYFIKSQPKVESNEIVNEDANISSETNNSLDEKQIHERAHGTLPESVLIHPSIGYSFRYGNVLLNGLDNSMNKPPVKMDQ